MPACGRQLLMPVNADKPHLWKADTRASVDQFNRWFMKFAPKAYRGTRKKTIIQVDRGLKQTDDLTTITPGVIKTNPAILPTLRMSTCPPLARDRLVGLDDSSKNVVETLMDLEAPDQGHRRFNCDANCNVLFKESSARIPPRKSCPLGHMRWGLDEETSVPRGMRVSLIVVR